jgi:hypothetical protein
MSTNQTVADLIDRSNRLGSDPLFRAPGRIVVGRYCCCLQVAPDRLAEYADRHRRVWPEMQAALRQTGWGNCSTGP